MSWTKYNYAIAFLMIVTGSINTLLTKWADKTSSPGRSGNYNDSGFNQTHPFNHPFLQSSGMFLGEISCLLVFRVGLIVNYNIRRHSWVKDLGLGPQTFSPFIFLPPALCDVIGSAILYTGLTMTTASSFQMLRCASIIFIGVLAEIFLRRRLLIYKWIGMFIVLLGLIIVGLSDFLLKKDSSETLTIQDQTIGYIMIVLAQIFTATQMILEEKFIGKYDVPPLQAVGWEGVFGLVIIILIIIPFNFIEVGRPFGKPPNGVLEDPIDGFVQIGNSWQILLATLGNIISIAFFNFAGITVTKELTATTRCTVLESVRMLVVWMFALAIGWETFTYLQPIGLIFLVIGMFVYHDSIFRPFLIRKGWLLSYTPEEAKNLLDKDETEIQSPD